MKLDSNIKKKCWFQYNNTDGESIIKSISFSNYKWFKHE